MTEEINITNPLLNKPSHDNKLHTVKTLLYLPHIQGINKDKYEQYISLDSISILPASF